MSQIPPNVIPEIQSPAPPSSNGLALASMICGICAIGLCCVWFLAAPLAIIAIVLGVLGLSLPNADGTPRTQRGRAKAGIACGVSAIPLGIAVILLFLLPALGQARKVAQMTKSMAQLNAIGTALFSYHSQYNAMPESDAVIEQRLASIAAPNLFISPSAKSGQKSYTYLPFDPVRLNNPGATIVVYENPEIVPFKVPVLFADGHVEALERADLTARLAKPAK